MVFEKIEKLWYVFTNKKTQYTSLISTLTNTDNYSLLGNRNVTIKGYFRGYAPVSRPCVIWGIKKYIYITLNYWEILNTNTHVPQL